LPFQTHVAVYDHHVDMAGDISPDEWYPIHKSSAALTFSYPNAAPYVYLCFPSLDSRCGVWSPLRHVRRHLSRRMLSNFSVFRNLALLLPSPTILQLRTCMFLPAPFSESRVCSNPTWKKQKEHSEAHTLEARIDSRCYVSGQPWPWCVSFVFPFSDSCGRLRSPRRYGRWHLARRRMFSFSL